MSAIEDGGPAFPVECEFDVVTGQMRPIQTGPKSGYCAGLSLRDWFAGQALNGMLAAGHVVELNDAYAAYAYADAMLTARKGGA